MREGQVTTHKLAALNLLVQFGSPQERDEAIAELKVIVTAK
jgi:hypothetical protein